MPDRPSISLMPLSSTLVPTRPSAERAARIRRTGRWLDGDNRTNQGDFHHAELSRCRWRDGATTTAREVDEPACLSGHALKRATSLENVAWFCRAVLPERLDVRHPHRWRTSSRVLTGSTRRGRLATTGVNSTEFSSVSWNKEDLCA